MAIDEPTPREEREKAASKCFLSRGFLPGLGVNALCAALALVLVERALDSQKLSIDGESAAYFMTALILPLAFSAAALVGLLASAVKSAGLPGFLRALQGYLLSLALAALALFVLAQLEPAPLRLILYRG